MAATLGLAETLALLIGLYFLVAGGMMAARPQTALGITDNLAGQPALCYLAGIVTLAIGGSMVAVHNDWSSLLAGFVSLVGWVALAEGLALIAFQERFVRYFAGLGFTDPVLRAFGVGTVVLGGVLLVAALR